MVCENGHTWKVWRTDKLTTDEGTKAILHFKCKVCGAMFNNSEEMDFIEKDYEGSENAEGRGIEYG